MAGSLAFKDAMTRARPTILEPIMQVEVYAPSDFAGDLMGDLNGRRGRIAGMDTRGTMTVIRAQVPMAEMLTYEQHLTSATGGRGSYHMEYSHYEEVPHRRRRRSSPPRRRREAETPWKRRARGPVSSLRSSVSSPEMGRALARPIVLYSRCVLSTQGLADRADCLFGCSARQILAVGRLEGPRSGRTHQRPVHIEHVELGADEHVELIIKCQEDQVELARQQLERGRVGQKLSILENRASAKCADRE